MQDTEEYQRITVQLHGKGVIPRDRVMGSLLKTKKQQFTKAYDLIVAEIDAKMGGFGIIPPELENAIVSNHYFLYEVDYKIVHPEFLTFYLSTDKPTADIQAFVKGSHNYASIRPEHFLTLEIPVPSLADQLHLIELQRKVADLEKIYASVKKTVGLILTSTYETLFENPDSIHQSEVIEKSAGLLSFDNRN